MVPRKVSYPTCTELVQQRRLLILKNLYQLIVGIKCTVRSKVRIVGRKSRKGNWQCHLNALFDLWFVSLCYTWCMHFSHCFNNIECYLMARLANITRFSIKYVEFGDDALIYFLIDQKVIKKLKMIIIHDIFILILLNLVHVLYLNYQSIYFIILNLCEVMQ